ncbi:SCO family protein [uncultured Sphingomonas sp.]|uniref:SCO family protein n=1 Tax=uncultured Sphingomonas sp. TaxID=158754 RepID=UPI0035CBB12D
MFRVVVLPLMILAVPACTPQQVARPPLEGAKIGGPFALIDQDGRPVTDAAFAGKYRIMYFGYTYCPDICPTDVQAIGAAMRTLEKDRPAVAARIVPVFVSVDPDRDTPVVVKTFVRAFYPRFVGLTGTPAAIKQAADAYGVYYAKGDKTPGGGYMVSHSRAAYLMGPDGKPIALLPVDGTADGVVAELERWVQ